MPFHPRGWFSYICKFICISAAGPNKHRVADASSITLREDPSIEFGRLEDIRDFGFGADINNPDEMQSMDKRMQEALQGDGLFAEAAPPELPNVTELEDQELMPPPLAPGRKRSSQDDQEKMQSTPIDLDAQGMEIDTTEISRMNDRRLRPFLDPKALEPFLDDSALETENKQLANIDPLTPILDVPEIEEEVLNKNAQNQEVPNEELQVQEVRAQEEQRETRSNRKEARLSVRNVNDDEVSSFQLLTPQIILNQTNRGRRGIRRGVVRGRGRGMTDGPVIEFTKEEMNARRQEGGCNDIVQKKEDLNRLRDRRLQAVTVDTLLLMPARHFTKTLCPRSSLSQRLTDVFQLNARCGKLIESR